MVEIGRFFDAVSYGETDQAHVQRRFRPTGVLSEVSTALAVSAPGGMFVSVAAGEAMVEGFLYENTVPKTLAIGTNTSGLTRLDRVVLRLDRTANTLTAVVKAGTPGGGYPGLTQVVDGTWELPLCGVTVANGAVNIVIGNLVDQRTYGNIIHNRSEVQLGAAIGTFPSIGRRVLTADASGALYFDENAPGRHNFLHNPAFHVNQRANAIVTNDGEHMVDRWMINTVNNVGFSTQMLYGQTAQSGSANGLESQNALYMYRTTATAQAANTTYSIRQFIDGFEGTQLQGSPMVLSFWALSTKAGVYGANLEQAGTNWKYISPFTINTINTWEFKTIQIPWSASGTWAFGANAATAYVRFVASCGTSSKTASASGWVNDPGIGSQSITNSLTAVSDALYITAPKLELGTLATRWETTDYVTELMKAQRYLFVEPSGAGLLYTWHSPASMMVSTMLPVVMRAAPAFSLPVVPAFTNGTTPTANNVAAMGNGAFISGMTYQSWLSWWPAAHSFVTMFTSSTSNSSGAVAGQSGLFLCGTNIRPVYSAEL